METARMKLKTPDSPQRTETHVRLNKQFGFLDLLNSDKPEPLDNITFKLLSKALTMSFSVPPQCAASAHTLATHEETLRRYCVDDDLVSLITYQPNRWLLNNHGFRQIDDESFAVLARDANVDDIHVRSMVHERFALYALSVVHWFSTHLLVKACDITPL